VFTYLQHRAGLSPIEQTRQMSDVSALTQLHSRWLQRTNQCSLQLVADDNNLPVVLTTLQRTNQCSPQLVADDNNLPVVLATLQNSVNCFYQVLSDGTGVPATYCMTCCLQFFVQRVATCVMSGLSPVLESP